MCFQLAKIEVKINAEIISKIDAEIVFQNFSHFHKNSKNITRLKCFIYT